MQRMAWKMAGMAVVVGGVVALLPGCESMYYSEGQQDLQEQQQMVAQQSVRQDAERADREVAALRGELRAFQDSQKQLYGYIDDLRQENGARAQEIEKLRGLVADLAARLNAADGNWREGMSSFKDKLAQDQDRAMKKFSNNVAEEMARNLNQVRQSAESSRPAPAAATQEYTVVAGDTVSAIAKAFNLSPASLCNANGIKGNVIRVGQKLKIPAK
jgi:nucleoid-associated protein YgaU